MGDRQNHTGGRGLSTMRQPDLSALHDHWLAGATVLDTVNRGEAARCTQLKPGFNLLRVTRTIPPGGWGLSANSGKSRKSKNDQVG